MPLLESLLRVRCGRAAERAELGEELPDERLEGREVLRDGLRLLRVGQGGPPGVIGVGTGVFSECMPHRLAGLVSLGP